MLELIKRTLTEAKPKGAQSKKGGYIKDRADFRTRKIIRDKEIDQSRGHNNIST